MAYRAAKGDRSPDVIRWQRQNKDAAPSWLLAFVQGMSDSAIPLNELPGIFGSAFTEAFVELFEGGITLARFAAKEVKHVVKGETLETSKGIALLGIFIGEEAARISLKEQTETMRYIREVASTFDKMSKQDRVKALAKIRFSITIPNGSVKVSVKAAITTQYNLRLRRDAKTALYKPAVNATFAGKHHLQPLENSPRINIPAKTAETFMGGKYESYILKEDICLYRVGDSRGIIGQYFTFDKPSSEILSRIDSAIKPVWPDGNVSIINTAYYVKIPKGTTIHIGLTAPQGGVFLGGTQQVFIENACKIRGVQVINSFPIIEELLWTRRAKKSS